MTTTAFRKVFTLLAWCVACVGANAAWAAEPVPCDHLDADTKHQYTSLADSSAEHYGAEDYQGAVDDILALKRLCDEDPRLDFNLARAYQRADNCNMARYWFEHLLERIGGDSRALAAERPRAAQKAIAELEQVCTQSARIGLDITDPDVVVTLEPVDGGAPSQFTFPFQGRIDAGTYRVIATKEGSLPTVVEVTIAANQMNRILVPELVPENAMGTITVTCPDRVTKTRMVPSAPVDGRGEVELDCGVEARLERGPWQARFAIGDYAFAEAVDVERNRHLELRLTRAALPESVTDSGDWGTGLLVAGGALAVAGGSLYVASELAQGEVLEPTSSDDTGTIHYAFDKRAADVEARGEKLLLAGLVTGGTGAALLVTGLILLMVDDDEPPTTTVTTGPSADGGWQVGLEATF